MDGNQPKDLSFADRLASKDFDAQQFISEIVSESIGDSDVLATKIKLQVFADKTTNQLRDGVTRNYSRFLSMANEVALLEDEMYNMRSLSNNYKSLRNLLKDFVSKEERQNPLIDKPSLEQHISESVDFNYGSDRESLKETRQLDTHKDELYLMNCLSMLVDQATSIGLIRPWQQNKQQANSGNITGMIELSTTASDRPESSKSITEDGRSLLYHTYLSQLEQDSLAEKTNRQMFIFDGCVLICTTGRPDYFNKSRSKQFVATSSTLRMRRLNLVTAMDIDSNLSVTDVIDESGSQSSRMSMATTPTTTGVIHQNLFKLIKSGREVVILKATSAQKKLECMNILLRSLEQSRNQSSQQMRHKADEVGRQMIPEHEKWGDTRGALMLLVDRLDELKLAIHFQQYEQAKNIILQCRQRLFDISNSGRINSDESVIQMSIKTLNQLEQKLVLQIKSEPWALLEKNRKGLGLRDPKRNIKVLRELGFNSEAVQLFIAFQEISFVSQQNTNTSPVCPDLFESIHLQKMNFNDDLYKISGTVGDNALNVYRSQEIYEQDNWISSFFNSIRRTEKNYNEIFGSDCKECMSVFIVWLLAKVNSDIDYILQELCFTNDNELSVLGRTTEVIKMLVNGCTGCNTLTNTENGSTELDLLFVIKKKLCQLLYFAIKKDQEMIINLVRSWNQPAADVSLSSNPLKVMLLKTPQPSDREVIKSCSNVDGDSNVNSRKLLYLINIAPELINDLDKLIINQDASGVNPESLNYRVHLSISANTLIFANLLIIFTKRCLLHFVEQMESQIVESLIDIIKAYIYYKGQLINTLLQSIQFIDKEKRSTDLEVEDMDPNSIGNNNESLKNAEFLLNNVKFIVDIVFRLCEKWFRQATGHSEKHFARIYERLHNIEITLQEYRH
ncbi:hypothetical protein GJ496_000994 [Pomphorhynchus laevis]|nr:hypothetical protein GJ496_000994 [Pomphorhynchus laevis]